MNHVSCDTRAELLPTPGPSHLNLTQRYEAPPCQQARCPQLENNMHSRSNQIKLFFFFFSVTVMLLSFNSSFSTFFPGCCARPPPYDWVKVQPWFSTVLKLLFDLSVPSKAQLFFSPFLFCLSPLARSTPINTLCLFRCSF